MSELLKALLAFDGKATSSLLEARSRFGTNADFLGQLAALIGSQEGSVSDGATWLIKKCAESGIVPGPPETAAIVARLDAVPTWQAALHLCQTAEFFTFTSDQARRFAEWSAPFLDHERPFVRAWSMNALQHAARQAPDLAPLAETALVRADARGRSGPGLGIIELLPVSIPAHHRPRSSATKPPGFHGRVRGGFDSAHAPSAVPRASARSTTAGRSRWARMSSAHQ